MIPPQATIMGLSRMNSPLCWHGSYPHVQNQLLGIITRLPPVLADKCNPPTSTLRPSLAQFTLTSVPLLTWSLHLLHLRAVSSSQVSLCAFHSFSSSLFHLASSLNCTWISRSFFTSSASISILALHPTPNLQLFWTTESSQNFPYSASPPGLQGFSFFWDILFLSPWTPSFRCPIANSYLALSSQLTWEPFLTREDLVSEYTCLHGILVLTLIRIFIKYYCSRLCAYLSYSK